jgi:hypothetical protein
MDKDKLLFLKFKKISQKINKKYGHLLESKLLDIGENKNDL